VRRVFVLLAHDSATGMATRPVGAIGLEDGDHYQSLLAHDPAGEAWRERLALVEAPLAEAVDAWLEAGGVAMDLAEVPPPVSPDLAGAVELVVDELLAMGAAADRGA
jgi:hypothetical protein